jgi:hypothetical protein
MNKSARDAALRLIDSLGMPRGTVNAMTVSGADGPAIRLLVNQDAMWRLGDVPASIDGYHVSVEQRGEVTPQFRS